MCLREEAETREGEEEEGEEAREAGERAPLAFAHTSAAPESPLDPAAPRAFPLLTAPPLFSPDSWVPGADLEPEPGGEELGCGRGAEVGARAPLPLGTVGGVD